VLSLIFLAWLAALAGLFWVLRSGSSSPDLLARLGPTCAAIGFVSTLYTGFPVLATTTCA
jgi:hypothetical protein